MKKILVTGGAGYIGAHTCKMLAKSGFEPVCFDNLSTGYAKNVKWGKLEIGDLQDLNRLIEVLTTHKPIAVIHFAANAYVGESVIDPLKYYYNNVGGALNLLKAMKVCAVKNIIFSSSCATYGNPQQEFINEQHPQQPINPYGQSKLMVEKIISDLVSRDELSQISLRYFNAAGADFDGEIGENHQPETHLIPLAIASAFGASPLKVFGTDFPTADGTAIRDYIHVEDLARAHVMAVEYLLAGGKSTFINLGNGRGYSIYEIIELLNDLGLKVNFINEARREGDPAALIADIKKAKTVLGWQPQIDINQTLSSAIKWYKSLNKIA